MCRGYGGVRFATTRTPLLDASRCYMHPAATFTLSPYVPNHHRMRQEPYDVYE